MQMFQAVLIIETWIIGQFDKFCKVPDLSDHQDEFFKGEDSQTEDSYQGHRTGGADGKWADRGGGHGKSR